MKTNLLMVRITIAMLFATAGCDDDWHMGIDPETVEKRIVLSPKLAEDAVRRIEDAVLRAATETNLQDIQDSPDSAPNDAN